MKLKGLIAASLLLLAPGARAQSAGAVDPRLAQIQHIVVMYLENHSFDNLYGTFPGADGIAHADATEVQVNDIGLPYQTLPSILDSSRNPPVADSRFPADLPTQPFNLLRYVQVSEATPDLVQRFYQEQLQIDGGQMDKYVLYSGGGRAADGLLRWHGLALVELCVPLHAWRPHVPCRLWRVVPQSFLADLRLYAEVPKRGRLPKGGGHRDRGYRQGRRSDARRVCG